MKKDIGKDFYCVYCNKSYLIDDKIHKRTKEHFIPKSIGGVLEIPLCNFCNQKMGESLDLQLRNITYCYKVYHRDRKIKTKGIVVLKNGRKFSGLLELKETRLIKFENDGELIYKDLIEYVILTIPSGEQLLSENYPVFAKIFLGGLYYLLYLHYVNHKTVQEMLNMPAIHFLREIVNPNSDSGAHNMAIQFSLISSEDANTIQQCFPAPKKRWNYSHIIQRSNGSDMTICLFSTYFVRLFLPEFSIGVEHIESPKIICDKLDEINFSELCKIQAQPNNINFHIKVSK